MSTPLQMWNVSKFGSLMYQSSPVRCTFLFIIYNRGCTCLVLIGLVLTVIDHINWLGSNSYVNDFNRSHWSQFINLWISTEMGSFTIWPRLIWKFQIVKAWPNWAQIRCNKGPGINVSKLCFGPWFQIFLSNPIKVIFSFFFFLYYWYKHQRRENKKLVLHCITYKPLIYKQNALRIHSFHEYGARSTTR